MKRCFKGLLFSAFLFLAAAFSGAKAEGPSDLGLSFNQIFYELDKYLSKELEASIKARSPKYRKELSDKDAAELKQEIDKERIAVEKLYKILSNADEAFQTSDPVEVTADSWRHVRLLSGDPETPDKNLWSKIDRSQTHLGRAVLAKMLCHPTKDLETLKSRQLFLRSLTISHELFDKFDSVISRVKKAQKDLLNIIGSDPLKDWQNILHESYGIYWSNADEFGGKGNKPIKDLWDGLKKINSDFRRTMDSSALAMNLSVMQVAAMKYISTRCFADNIIQNLEWVVNPRYLGPLRKLRSTASFEKNKIDNLRRDLKTHEPILRRAVKGEFDKLNEDEIGKIGNVLYQLFETTNAQNVAKSKSFINPIQKDIFFGEWNNIKSYYKQKDRSFKKLQEMLVYFIGQRIVIPGMIGTTFLYQNLRYAFMGTKDWVTAIKKSFEQTGAMREIFDCHKRLAFLADQMGPSGQQALSMIKHSEKSIEQKINNDLAWLTKNLSTSIQSPGNFLKAYKMVYELKSKLAHIFGAIGQVDAYLSMARLKLEMDNKHNGLCFADFVESDKPLVQAKQCWELFLNPDIAKTSAIDLDRSQPGSNAVLTGPNAGGKSTFMRSVFMSALLAQTFGLAPAKEYALTPFSGLFSYMNVMDNPSKGKSLFQTEVELVVDTFEKIKDLANHGGRSLFIVDEMFSGTNPIDARAILQAICKECANIEQTTWVVSTHLPGAAKAVVENSGGVFKGLMVRSKVLDNGDVVSDHEIVPGISTQSTAMDVAKKANLEPKILDLARQIKEGLAKA